MALAIRTIPTLHGKEAEAFERAAREAETNRGRIDITEDAKLLKKYLRKMGF